MRIEVRTADKGEDKKLLKIGENHFHEVKSYQIKPSVLQRHFVAFANADGGEMYIGIEDRKVNGERLLGFKTIEEANDVVSVLLEETQPSVENVDLEFINFKDKGFVLHIAIPKSPRVHYTAKRECYLRLNASSIKIEGERISHLAYAKGHYSFEKVAIENLDVEEIINGCPLRNYMERIETNQQPLTFLKKQQLIVIKNPNTLFPIVMPTAGCVLMFDEEPQAALPNKCSIKVYRLRTTDSEYKREHLEGKPITINGPLETQIYRVIECVDDLLKDATYKAGNNLVKLRYPSETLKELLVNAVIHRDYSLNDDVHVRIYDNRIEILSPGKLPGYITLENILDERYARNPTIVRMLNNLPDPVNHDIGEGLNTAFNEMRKAGLVHPEITELENAVVVVIKHQRMASLEDQILDYLKDNEFITNKIVRSLSG